MRKLRIVQIGTEHDHAWEAFKTVCSLPDLFEVAGYCMPPEDGDYMWGKHPEVFAPYRKWTPEEVWNAPDLDAVLIETSDYLLTKYAKAAFDAGLSVEMDKPGGVDADEFDQMVDTAAKKGLGLQLGYMYRFNPAIRKLYEMAEAGELGEILYINAEMNCFHNGHKREWLARYPGGMMYFLGCHMVDIIYRLQGEPMEILPLSADTERTDLPSVDIGFAAFRYRHGTSFVRTTSEERGGFERRQIVAVGTRGTFEIRPIETRRFCAEDPGDNMLAAAYRFTNGTKWADYGERIVTAPFHRYRAMLTSFYEIAAGIKKNPYSPEYEKRLHRLILQACGEE